MADLTLTAANVVASGSAELETGKAGATITAGQVVYKEAATGQFKLADADHASAEARIPYGIALNGGSTGQTITVAKSGDVTIGATMTAGVAYYLSGTAGGICPVADVGAGERVVLLGFAISTTVLRIRINDTGVAL